MLIVYHITTESRQFFTLSENRLSEYLIFHTYSMVNSVGGRDDFSMKA